MNITCLLFGFLFVAAGIVFAMGKAHVHLTAWKNTPDDEKARIRIMPLCRNIGGMIALCGLIFLTSGVWSAFKDHAFLWSMAAWIVLVVLDVRHIGKSGRYKVE